MLDDEIDELFAVLPVIAIEGPKGVGKTRTALQRACTVYQLDDPAVFALAQADPMRLLEGERPILIDEWQRMPPVWDLVRRADDDGAEPGSFLLTGSASPDPPPTHSGAARIVSLRMRPLAFSERGYEYSVSLADLLSGSHPSVQGESSLTLKITLRKSLRQGYQVSVGYLVALIDCSLIVIYGEW